MVAGGQGEIDMKYTTMTTMADSVMYYKYIIRNVAKKHGMSLEAWEKSDLENTICQC